jgi:hypothetical protein
MDTGGGYRGWQYSSLPHGGTGKECGLIASLFVIEIVVILLVFYVLGVPQ